MPQLSFARRTRRTKGSCARQRCRAAYARPTHPPGDSRRREHAGLRKKLEPGGNHSARRVSRDPSSIRPGSCPRCRPRHRPSRERHASLGSFMASAHQTAMGFLLPSGEIILGTLVLLSFIYVRGWRRTPRVSASAIPAWRAASFLFGMFLIWGALGSPLVAYDHDLLTVHMIQHLL